MTPRCLKEAVAPWGIRSWTPGCIGRMGKVSSQADKERIEFGRRIEFGTIINEGADFKVGSWMDGRADGLEGRGVQRRENCTRELEVKLGADDSWVWPV